jgi:G3E family GTPase/predicted RNA-binding protein with TRAM domain
LRSKSECDMARKKANYPLIEGLEITTLAAEGKAMGRYNDVVVFVPMTVPGDVVDVQIRSKRRRYMEGFVVNYVKRSPLREEPLDRWYEVGNVIAIVDANLEEHLSEEAEYILASEVANAGEIILSHADEVSAEQADTTVAHLNRALEQIKCPRRVDKEVLRKSTLDLNEEDFNRLISCGYQMESYRKLDMEEKKGFESVYFMNVKMTEEQLKTTVGKLMNDRECGEVFRVKGFLQKEDGSWIQLNATHNGITMNPIEKGQEVIIVIGEELKEQAIKKYFLKQDSL